jgi:hypothetical protein
MLPAFRVAVGTNGMMIVIVHLGHEFLFHKCRDFSITPSDYNYTPAPSKRCAWCRPARFSSSIRSAEDSIPPVQIQETPSSKAGNFNAVSTMPVARAKSKLR